MAKTITVACKLPHGLNLGPGPDGRNVVLNGARHASSGAAAGFGLTSNIDAEWWERWKADHKGFSALANGLIFDAGRRDHAQAESVTREGLKTGLERLDPDALPAGLEETDDSKKQRQGRRVREAAADTDRDGPE